MLLAAGSMAERRLLPPPSKPSPVVVMTLYLPESEDKAVFTCQQQNTRPSAHPLANKFK